MAEIEHIVTEYTIKLGDAGTVTIRYFGPPLSQLPENQAKFVRGLMKTIREVDRISLPLQGTLHAGG